MMSFIELIIDFLTTYYNVGKKGLYGWMYVLIFVIAIVSIIRAAVKISKKQEKKK
jgi:hypothetical protein